MILSILILTIILYLLNKYDKDNKLMNYTIVGVIVWLVLVFLLVYKLIIFVVCG
jgi:hypothetical protein